jgi:hypothetical protein
MQLFLFHGRNTEVTNCWGSMVCDTFHLFGYESINKSSYIPTCTTCSPENNCTDVKEIYHGLLNTGIKRAVSPFSYTSSQQAQWQVVSRLRKDAPYPMDRRET